MNEKLEFAGYFGQKYHIITSRKQHICKLCGGIIEADSKCIRIFKPVIVEKNGVPQRRGWIQVFYHIECVRKDFEYFKFKKTLEYKMQIKKCKERNCTNYVNGHCVLKVGNTLLVDCFDYCRF